MRCDSVRRCGGAAGWRLLVVDASDLARPKGAGSYNYHPLFRKPIYTVMPVPDRIRRAGLRFGDRRGGPGGARTRRRRGAERACALVDLRRQRSRRHRSRSRSFRSVSSTCPSAARAARASAPADQFASGCRMHRLRRLVRRRAADHRRRHLSAHANIGQFLDSRAAGGGQGRAAEQRRGTRPARPHLYGRPPRRLRHSGVSGETRGRTRTRLNRSLHASFRGPSHSQGVRDL